MRWILLTSYKEPVCQCKRCRRRVFHPWVRKFPWRRKWHPTPGFLPGKFHGQKSLVGYCHGVIKSRTRLSDWARMQSCTHACRRRWSNWGPDKLTNFLRSPCLLFRVSSEVLFFLKEERKKNPEKKVFAPTQVIIKKQILRPNSERHSWRCQGQASTSQVALPVGTDPDPDPGSQWRVIWGGFRV